jgi:allantoinase
MSPDDRFPPLPTPGRFIYRAIDQRPDYCWPNQARLAVYIGFNIEHFAFGEGLGACLGPPSPQPDVLNYSWREYGNRVGAWRCLELFEQLALPTGVLLNSALYDHCPELVAAFQARGDELIAHGHSNAVRQSDLSQDDERLLLRHCRERIARESGVTPAGWLSPWISETRDTPDLLAETGYRYTLNWGHDDQPVRMQTAHGTLWSIPYSQEANDIPMIIHRQMDGRDFSRLIIDQFDEMLEQSRQQPLVLGLALHPYIIGQPHRLRHLRTALEHIAAARDAKRIWMTTPGAICRHVDALGLD